MGSIASEGERMEEMIPGEYILAEVDAKIQTGG